MRRFFIPLLFCLFALLSTILTACEGDSNAETTDTTEPIPPTTPALPPTPLAGVVHTDMSCVIDPSTSFALYMPSNYSAKYKWPVLFAFDPHAKGIDPVEKYKDLAEEFGMIIVGSNSAQNGMDFQATDAIVNTLMAEIESRLSTDPARLYTTGFSGGARVASRAAQVKGGIAGVIGCSGGFASQDLQTSHSFVYYGLAGNGDFNYLEMISLDRGLDGTGIPHFIDIYEGEHDWPPAEVMRKGLYWFTFEAIRNHDIPQNDSLVAQCKLEYEAELAALSKQKGDQVQYQIYRRKTLQSILVRGIEEIDALHKEVTETLPNSAAVKRFQGNMNEWERQEMEMRQTYSKELPQKDLVWWRQECTKLTAEANKKTAKGNMYFRVLNFLSLSSYMYASQTLDQNQFAPAEKYLDIYTCVDPDNPEHRYLTALLRAKMGDSRLAMSELFAATALGFDDLDRIEKELLFLNLLGGTPEFEALKDDLKRQNQP